MRPPSANESSILLRPASLYKYLISRGPLLIGWDDDKLKDLIEQSKAHSRSVDTSDHGKDLRSMEEIKSNLSHIFIDALVINLTTQFMQKEEDEQYERNNTNGATCSHDLDTKGYSNEIVQDKVPLYNLLSQIVKYHRDAYLTGPTYASIQRFQRNQKRNIIDHQPYISSENLMTASTWNNHIPLFHSWNKEQSLAGEHLQGFVTWFLPSRKTMDLVRPTVLWTISPPVFIPTSSSSIRSTKGGPLYAPLVQAVTNLIPLSQTLFDEIIKDNVIRLLQDPEWRVWVKGTTGGYVSRLQRDVDNQR